MVKKINRLSACAVATLAKPGHHSYGGGLYLKVDNGGAKRWTFMWMRNGRQREAGLGSVNAVPLIKAREKAAEMRAALADGRDPIEARQATRAERDSRKTFGDVANAFLKDNTPSWRNAKHQAQWKMTLEVYGKSLLHMPVENIDTPAVLEALKPIWQDKPETASRLRGRIEAVLDAARASGLTPADRLVDLVQMPSRMGLRSAFAQVRRDHWSEALMSKFRCLRTLVAELNWLEYRLFLADVTRASRPVHVLMPIQAHRRLQTRRKRSRPALRMRSLRPCHLQKTTSTQLSTWRRSSSAPRT